MVSCGRETGRIVLDGWNANASVRPEHRDFRSLRVDPIPRRRVPGLPHEVSAKAGIEKLSRRDDSNALASVDGKVLEIAGNETLGAGSDRDLQEWLIAGSRQPAGERHGCNGYAIGRNTRQQRLGICGTECECRACEHFTAFGQYSGVVAHLVRAPGNQSDENSRWTERRDQTGYQNVGVYDDPHSGRCRRTAAISALTSSRDRRSAPDSRALRCIDSTVRNASVCRSADSVSSNVSGEVAERSAMGLPFDVTTRCRSRSSARQTAADRLRSSRTLTKFIMAIQSDRVVYTSVHTNETRHQRLSRSVVSVPRITRRRRAVAAAWT